MAEEAYTFEHVLTRVIEDGITAARADYGEKDGQREGAVAGFEACRGKMPEQLAALLAEAGADCKRARREEADDYWYWRCREAEIEWTCNVISAVMLNQGMPPIISPTARGVMKAAEIVGVAEVPPVSDRVEHGPSESARIQRLYAQMERLKAELTAVETGTLPLLEERGELVATDLAEAVGVSVQAANNRLVALVRAGLAERVRVNPVRGGKRFVYRVVGGPSRDS